MKYIKWIYIIAVIAGGTLLFLYHLGPLNEEEVVLVYFLAGLSIIIGRISIILPSKQLLRLDSTVFLATVILYGPMIANWIVLLSIIHLFFYARMKIYQMLYCLGYFIIMLEVALRVYILAGEEVGNFNLLNPWPFFLASILYMILNGIFVAVVVALEGRNSFLRVFVDLFKSSTNSYLMMIIYAFILAVLLMVQTYMGALIFLVMVVITADNYKKYFDLLQKVNLKANQDFLTGVYNHRYFHKILKEKIALASEERPLSLLFVDIDHFKRFNDRLGHQAGDKLLQQFAGLLKNSIPEEAVLARYGGEEFVIILPNMDVQEAYQLAEDLRKTISDTVFEGLDIDSRMSASFGLSTYPTISQDAQALVRNADQALYIAKHLGRNQIKIYSIKHDAPKQIAAIRSEQELNELIESLMSMLRAKDKPTYDHSMRVYQYAMSFAEWLNLDENERRILRMGSILHDLGKMEIPRDILNKKGPLLDYEWTWVKKHAEYGESLLKGIKELQDILPLVRWHHERYDGTGYPDQLKGEEIPYLVRLLSIVDSFDAMTTNRAYQQTKTFREAIHELRRCSGKQFDPILLESFIQMLEKIRYQEKNILQHVEGI